MVSTYAADKHVSPPLLVGGGAIRDWDHRDVTHLDVSVGLTYGHDQACEK
jgi:hypothetical protein